MAGWTAEVVHLAGTEDIDGPLHCRCGCDILAAGHHHDGTAFVASGLPVIQPCFRDCRFVGQPVQSKHR